MKKWIFIASTTFALLLSLAIGGFVIQNSEAFFGRPHTFSTAAKAGSDCTQSQKTFIKQHGTISQQCRQQSRSKHGKVAVPTLKPAIVPRKSAIPTPTLAQVIVALTPLPQALTPTPATISNTSSISRQADTMATQLQEQLFNQINSDRAAQRLPAYHRNSTLDQGANQHSKNMAQCGLSHQCPGEPDPCQRVSDEGVDWMNCGENVGYTSYNSNAWSAVKQNIEGGMLAEQPPNDGHRKNLLSQEFQQVGIGIYIDAKNIIWVTEDFTN